MKPAQQRRRDPTSAPGPKVESRKTQANLPADRAVVVRVARVRGPAHPLQRSGTVAGTVAAYCEAISSAYTIPLQPLQCFPILPHVRVTRARTRAGASAVVVVALVVKELLYIDKEPLQSRYNPATAPKACSGWGFSLGFAFLKALKSLNNSGLQA
jgi:hypothetical protein